MTKSVAELVKEAKENVENLSPEQVQEELQNGATLVDIRETEEISSNGKIPGSVHAPRGMLEFYADDATPYHKDAFEKNNRIILHCASGGRSALAAKTLKEMGYENIAHLDGGIKAWKEAGLGIE